MAEEYTIMLYVNFALERVADSVSNAGNNVNNGKLSNLCGFRCLPFVGSERYDSRKFSISVDIVSIMRYAIMELVHGR